MAKRISDYERVRTYFLTASAEELASTLRVASAIMDARFPKTPATKPAAKRGPGRPKREAAGVGFAEGGSA